MFYEINFPEFSINYTDYRKKQQMKNVDAYQEVNIIFYLVLWQKSNSIKVFHW
jgi:hypothetical protein